MTRKENRVIGHTTAYFSFSAAPVITSVNSSVNSTSKEATLDCYAHASPSPLVTWRLTEDIPSTLYFKPYYGQRIGFIIQPFPLVASTNLNLV